MTNSFMIFFKQKSQKSTSHNVASGSDVKLCNKIHKPLFFLFVCLVLNDASTLVGH